MNTKKRVLCVEDNPDDCDLIKTYLGWEDIEVVFAGTSAEGLLKAKTDRFDLFLIDEALPDGSGVDLTLQIRDFDTTTPILFHSAHCYASSIEKAFQAGAQQYIKKPSVPDDVVRIIKTHLGEKGGDAKQGRGAH
jgi:DNA-binding response OmpR family regulator